MAMLATRHDIIRLLTADHEEVRRLLKRLPKATGKQAHDLFVQAKTALDIHTRIEEELVYPAYRDMVGGHDAKVMVHESLLEHDLVDRVLAGLAKLNPGTAEFEGKATVLQELVDHHARDEEKHMFPKLRKSASQTALERLAKQVEARKAELLAGGSPAGGSRRATSTSQQSLSVMTKEELYEQARQVGIDGRSRMDKDELIRALKRR